LQNQGVRIGPIDLKQANLTTLMKMDIDKNLVTRFKPYIGEVDQVAIDLLKATPLVLTQPEMDALTEKFKIFGKNEFEKLPKLIQNNPRVNMIKKF
jgi:hypothetical protein